MAIVYLPNGIVRRCFFPGEEQAEIDPVVQSVSPPRRRGADGRNSRILYVLPRHKAANWVGRGRTRKATLPGANGVVELKPFEFLDRLADLVPPPRKRRHRYHGVLALNQ